MYNLWPLLIISVSFLIIIFIIFRHFPALAVLDVENIPEEKEDKIKEKIIKERIKRKFSFLEDFFDRVLAFFNRVSNIFWSKLDKIKEDQREKQENLSLSAVSISERMKILFSQAEVFIKQDNCSEAEKRLIEVISLDDKNFLAFWKLGEVYYFQEKWQEAKQTLLYALKLSEVYPDKVSPNELSNLNYTLSLINKELNDIEGAFSSIINSLNIDPKNPRYLDLALDLCIIRKDKNLAIDYLERIKEVNPENNNIDNWEKEISFLV